MLRLVGQVGARVQCVRARPRVGLITAAVAEVIADERTWDLFAIIAAEDLIVGILGERCEGARDEER